MRRRPYEFCFDYLTRLAASHSTYDTVMEQIAGTVEGISCSARIRRWARPMRGCNGLAWRSRRSWSATSRDRRATWWKDGPEIESGELRTRIGQGGVFLSRGRAHREVRDFYQHPADAAMAR